MGGWGSRNRGWVAPLQPQCTISAGAITVRSALAETRPAQAPLLLDFRKHAGTESTSCARVVLHLVRAFSHELKKFRLVAAWLLLRTARSLPDRRCIPWYCRNRRSTVRPGSSQRRWQSGPRDPDSRCTGDRMPLRRQHHGRATPALMSGVMRSQPLGLSEFGSNIQPMYACMNWAKRRPGLLPAGATGL